MHQPVPLKAHAPLQRFTSSTAKRQTRTMARLMTTERTTHITRQFLSAAACVTLLLASAFVSAQQPNGQTAAAQFAANQQARKVQDIIARAESNYRSGVANYNSNHLDAARQDFDAAVDIMLSSGIDLKGDPQLSDEFDHLLSAINSLEMVALKQGNGFSPRVEAAPLDAATDITFPANPELVAKLKTELNTTSDLPLVINDQVAGYIGVFSNSPGFRAHMAASLKRAGKYKAMIQGILAKENMPQDLIYLAVAESGFQPQALNAKSGAGGMWQFMPFSGYGLQRNGYFDERFDPEKSSVAYAKYMKALYNQFGDWYLAMAAYDWGPGYVQRLVSRTGYADYWELYRRGGMPAETRAYVPQILAAVIMAKNPEKYGLDKVVLDPPLLYDTVTTDYAIDMKLVADVTDTTVASIVALNPALLRLTTPRDMQYDLHIPQGTRDQFNQRLKDIPEDKRANWRFHIVRTGETIDSIATSFHARPAEIAEVNEVSAAKPLAVDDELVVPLASTSNIAQRKYTMRKSDTLVTVADRFGITVEQLRSWNHLTAGRVAAGRDLYVAEPVRLAPGTHATRGRKKRDTTRHARTTGSARSTHATSVTHPAPKSSSKKSRKKR